jgi:phage shock protein PspC (stress-responsive transcriptional regulator)
MGPVDSGLDAEGAADDRPRGDGGNESAGASRVEPRRLFRLKDDAMIAGVCAGIAAYFGLDPTIVRVIFVVLLATTAGTAGAIYIVLLVFVPEAKTPEEKAAAYGAPFNAQDVLNQAKTKFDDMTSGAGSEKWKRQWRAQQRYWRRQGHDVGDWAPFLILFFGLFFGMSLLVQVGRGIFGPQNLMGLGMPWVGPWFPIVLILAGVAIVVAGRRDTGVLRGTLATILSLIAVLFFLWFAFTTIPTFQVWINGIMTWWCRGGLWGC